MTSADTPDGGELAWLTGPVTIRLEQRPELDVDQTTVIAETDGGGHSDVVELVRLSIPRRVMAAAHGDRRVADLVCRIACDLLHIGPHPDHLPIPSRDGISPGDHG